MIGVITGDIIHSRRVTDPGEWLYPLKGLFNEIGATPETWEIYRGDSFQLEVNATEALAISFRIKAIIRSVKKLDVRMAIGIGGRSYKARGVTESSGEAYLLSGETFENLKRQKRSLMLKSPWEDLNEEFNLMLKLALVIINDWSITSASTAGLVLQNTATTQQKLAEKLKISQPSVSARYNRANLHEIVELLAYYKKRIRKQIQGE